MGDTAQYCELRATVRLLLCNSLGVYIPFMFQQCDKGYTDAFQGVSAAPQEATFHNNLIFETMLLYLRTAFI